MNASERSWFSIGSVSGGGGAADSGPSEEISTGLVSGRVSGTVGEGLAGFSGADEAGAAASPEGGCTPLAISCAICSDCNFSNSTISFCTCVSSCLFWVRRCSTLAWGKKNHNSCGVLSKACVCLHVLLGSLHSPLIQS